MLLSLVTPAAAEPVTLAEAKAHLRVLHASEDAIITQRIKAARSIVENATGRALITQTWDFWLPAWPLSRMIELPRPPLQSVTSIKYRDLDGTLQTLDPAQYSVVAPGLIGFVERVPGAVWPRTQTLSQAVNVRFVAGYGDDGTDVHEDLRSALFLLVEHLYRNRGAVTETSLKPTPMGVDDLLGPYKTYGWGPSQVINPIGGRE